jgi:hypothetical protein
MEADRVTGPLAGAVLTVVNGPNNNARVTTDAAGRFAFDRLEAGRLTVNIGAAGYVAVTPVIDLYQDIDTNFGLRRQ